MANLKRTLLGIDISPSEVRIVEVRGGVPPRILKVGTVPLPPGAVSNDQIAQIETVADLVRGLYTRLGCTARQVVCGMNVQSVVTRILAIPRVPDADLRYVIEGELQHYQVLRTGTGAFDYFRLDAASQGEDTPPSVLVMASEERVAYSYRQVIEKAGLQLLALEPITLGLFRAAYPEIEQQPAALCLAVTSQRSELSILDHAQIRLYRRLELGSDDMVQGRRQNPGGFRGAPMSLVGEDDEDNNPMPTYAPRPPRIRLDDDSDTADLEDEAVPPGVQASAFGGYDSANTAPGGIVAQAAVSLGDEVQRTLDYYQREYPNATAISRVMLATNDPQAGNLRDWLAQTLRMDVRLVALPDDPTMPRNVSVQLEAPNGLRYLGAVGLAMQAFTGEWRNVPRFNLAPGGQAAAIPIERDRLTAVLIASISILAGGLFFGIMFNRQAQASNQRIKEMEVTLGSTRRDYAAIDKKISDEQTLNYIVKSDALPMPFMLDLVTQNMPLGVGLINLEFKRDGHIIVEGNAKDPQLFNAYYLGVMSCQYFVNPRWTQLKVDPKSQLTNFKIETGLRGTKDGRSPQSSVPGIP